MRASLFNSSTKKIDKFLEDRGAKLTESEFDTSLNSMTSELGELQSGSDRAERLRQVLRTRSLKSLYFFCKIILGFKDMTPDLHKKICRYLQQDSHRRKLVELPRGHLKTHIGTIGYSLWRVVKDPNIRILLATATSTNSSKWLRNIENIIETNRELRWLFPEIIPDLSKVKWTENEMEVRRTRRDPVCTIEAIGIGGTAVSRHYDLIIKDDLVNDDHILSTEQMDKVVEWDKYAESLFVSPSEGEEVLLGTRWAFNDVISHAKANKPYMSIFSRAVIHGDRCYPKCNEHKSGEPIWPERFPPEEIDRLLELYGPRLFSSQYMNDPSHDSPISFDKKWLRHFSELPQVPLRYYTAVDPAMALKRGDYSAIVTVGMDPDRNIYVVDARRNKWGVDELIDNIFEVYSTWKPVSIGIETVMFQKALLWPIREAMRRHNVHFTITELRPSSRITKEARISALHEFFENGSLWLREGLRDLEREIVEFPLGAHDDVIDALAYVVQMARPAQLEQKSNNNPFLMSNIIHELQEKHRPSRRLWTYHNVPIGVN